MNVINNKEPRNTQNTRKGVLNRVFSCVLWFMMICAAFSSYAGVVEATSPVFGLSVKHDGVRQSAGVETLTYSSQWNGGEDATVTIAQDGMALVEGLTGEGTRSWSVTRNGTYVLTHTTYTNGVAGKVETATFVVTGKDIPFAVDDVTVAGFTGKYDGAAHGVGVMVKEGIEDVVVRYAAGDGAPALPWSETAPTITDVGSMTVWCEIAAPGYITQTNSATVVISPREVKLASGTATKVYDGTALVNGDVTVDGDGFVDGEGASYNVTGSQTNVGESENAFAYTLNDNTKAGNYVITTVNGTLTVTKANVGGGIDGGEEPGAGEVPQGGVSKFDASFVYDGEGHTIDTNALTAAFGSAMVGASAIEYAVDDGSVSGGVGHAALPWDATAPVYTNAGEYIVWYRVTNPNYEDFVHAARILITPRNVTLTSGGAEWVYDGEAHSQSAVSVTGDGFAAGEGASYSGFPVVRHVADAATPRPNTFEYTLNANTKAQNYVITTVNGMVKMSPRAITLTAPTKEKDYDGAPLTFGAAEVTATLTSGGQGLPALPNGETFTLSNFASITEAGRTDATFTVADGTALMADYAITTVPGTLTVRKNATEITVTAKSGSWVYDGTAHTLHEYEATNLGVLQSGDALEVTFSDESVVTTPMNGAEGNGVVPNVITVVRVIRNGAEDVTANYTVEWFPGTLTVTKRPVTVMVVGKSATYTYDSEEKTVTGYDISTEDELYDIAADTVFSGGVGHAALPSAVRTDAGKSDMGLSAGNFANNNDCFEVTYQVTDGWVKIVPADIATGAEGDFAIVLGENPKYNGTVQTIPVGSVTYKGMDVTYTLAGENATHAGTYTLTVKANGNFTGERSTTWQVLKRNVTFTSASATKAYDASPLVNPNVMVGGDGFIGIEGAAFDVTGSQIVAGSSKNTFSYTLKAGTLAGDYDITKIEGELVVTKAKYPGQEPGGAGIKWNVAADAATWMYDGKMHEVSLTGVPAGVTAHILGNAAKDAGEYTASVTFDYDEANFDAPVVPAPLKWAITKRPISLKTVNAEKPYDGFPLSVEAANITPGMSGYADSECFEYFDLASITEVGETPATFNYRDSATAKVANYAVQVIGGAVLKVTVGGDQISVTAKDGVWCYDGEEHALREWNIVNGDKLIAGHEFQIKIADESVITTPKDGELGDGIVSNRFEYVRIVDSATGADRTCNYNLFLYEGKLQVTNACIGVEMLDGIENVEKIYDGAATNVVVAADLLQPATVKYCGGRGISVLPENPQWADEPLEFTDAGEYTVWYEVTADYYNTYTGKVEVTIAKRPVTLTSPTKAKPYDGAALTFDANEIVIGGDGLVDGESFAFSGFASITDAGRVDATFDYAAGANTSLENYAVTVVAGTLTVNASADEITVTAKSGVWKYDSLEHTLHDCEVVNGDVLQSGDELVVEYDTASRVTTPDDGEVENRIVSVKVMRGGAEGEDVTRNYSIAVYPGTLHVVNADVTFGSIDTSAFSTKAVYDGEGHTIAVTAPSLLTSPVTVTYAETAAGPWRADPMAVAVKNAGTHTIRYRVSAKYYNDYIGEAAVVISPREVTLTSGSATKVYDGMVLVNGHVTVGGDGFVDGEGASYNVTGSQTNVGDSENAFTYTLNDSTKAGNYNITTVNGTLTVTKANVGGGAGGGEEPGAGEVPQGGVSKFDASFVYDGEGHTIDTNALTAAFGSAMVGACAVEYAVDDGSAGGGRGAPALPWLETTPVYTNAGEYVVWYRVTNPNYEDFVHAAKLSITKRPVAVSVAGHTVTCAYDTTEKTVSGYDVATEDALYDIAANTVFGGAALASRTDVGTTAMGLSAANFANNNENFEVTYRVTDGWLKIEPRIIVDDPANWDIRLDRAEMYDGTEKSAPIIQVAFVKPDGNLDYIPYTLEGNTATDAGNYKLRITGAGNYSGTVEKDWAITPRNVTLTSGGAEWVYDGEAHSQSTVSVTGDGFATGEGASYSGFPVVRHVADAATPRPNTFEYTLNANTKAQNYVITTVNGTVKMSPRAITLTAPTKEKDYDGAPLTFGADEIVASLTNGGQGLPALPNGETFTLSNFASITEAGRTDATFTVADGTALMADYAITTVPGTLTVRKNATEITVTAKSGSWVYDGTVHTLHEYEATNLGVLQPGDALDVTFSDESVVTTPMDGAEGNGVVENVITAVRIIRNGKDDVTANYTLAPYNGTLTVMKRPVTLTSKSDSKVYDGEELTAHEIEVGGDGFVGEDGATYVFTGSQTEKGKSKNTFTYSLKGGTNAAFYDITKVEGELEVTALDIAGGGDEDWEIVFGPALTYTGLEQVQTLSSVTYKGLSLDYTVSGNIQKNAGAYRMTLAGQGNFAGTHEVEWSIAPKALTLTAGSGSRVYDGAPFTVGSVTAVGFVSGEGAEYECDGSQKDVGTSPNAVSAIRWNANTLGGNYAVTKVAGTLTVTPRPVTLTAANISKPYDGAPLALTAADIAADGLVAGESFVYSNFASRTEAGQTPATFDYAPGAGTSLANYTVTVTPGRTVTITKSATAISVTAASESWVYDGEVHSNRTWTATNLDTLQTGDALEVTFDEASVVKTPQDGANGDGIVPNVITGVRVIRSGVEDVTANYTVEWFPGTLAVTKRPVTVTVVGESATYTYDSEEKTVTGYDISTEDELYDIAADTVFGGTQSVSRTDAGKTEMGLSAADFTNDNDCFDVTYAVTDGWVKIVPADIATGAEGDFAIVLGENPKYNGTVQTIPVGSVTYKGMDVTYTLAGENATHAGTYTLTVKANGNFTGERSTTWQVLKRNVTFTSASATKAYDASPLVNPNVTVGGDGFIGIEGAAFDVTGSQTVAGSSKNIFSYTLKAGTLAGDYDITKIEGELVVTKANVGGGTSGGEEPGDGEVPQGGVSKFDASFVYDGEGHTIDTNALTEVFGNAMAGVSVIEYAIDDGSVSGGVGHAALPWDATAPVYTNAGEYIVWYRVTNPNYEDFTHAAKLTITPRTGVVVDIVGNVATNVYNGTAQSVDGYTVAINDSLYKETDFEFAGTSAVSGTAPGKYPIGLIASQFTNKNMNFAGVTFNVTDGELVILGSLQKSVILDALGGRFADGSVVTQECEDVYLTFPVATREGYVFDGWYLGVTNGALKASAGAELLVGDDHTLFAKWKIDEALMPGEASIFAWETIDANTARITGLKNPEQKLSSLIFPDTIDGKAVVEIADGAFANSRSGMTRILLPIYCVKIGYAAFTGISTLTDIVFSDVRKWQTPDVEANLTVGAYAFSGAGVSSVILPATVSAIGDYAFANCAKLSNITILGQPAVGTKPLRRAGTSVGGVTVHLDPALASDNAYMNALKQECLNVTVRADAIVKRMKLSSLSMARNFIVLSVSVEKAAAWGKVDLSAIKVAYRKTLSDEPLMLTPSAIVENPDGSLSVEVPMPAGDSGFFQVVFQK